jgi:DNA mismatch repair protein MSH2
MSTQDRSFASFFRSLPSAALGQRRLRFFSRDGGGFFTCHGEDAAYIAVTFYSTQSVVRETAGLPTVSVAYNLLLRRVLPTLLKQNAIIEIWEPSARDTWKLARSGGYGCILPHEDAPPVANHP